MDSIDTRPYYFKIKQMDNVAIYICPSLVSTLTSVCLHVRIIITMETLRIFPQTNKLPPKNYCSVSPKALPSSLSHWYDFHPRFLYFCLRLKYAAVIYFLLEIHYLVVAVVLWMAGVGLINSGSLLPPTPHSSPPQLVQTDCASVCACVCACVCVCVVADGVSSLWKRALWNAAPIEVSVCLFEG